MGDAEVDKLAACLTVTVKREKLLEAYQLMRDKGMVRSEADFSRKVGLSWSATWHLLHREERMPLLVTLRKLSSFLMYWLSKAYTRRHDCTAEELAERLLESEALRDELARKLGEPP